VLSLSLCSLSVELEVALLKRAFNHSCSSLRSLALRSLNFRSSVCISFGISDLQCDGCGFANTELTFKLIEEQLDPVDPGPVLSVEEH